MEPRRPEDGVTSLLGLPSRDMIYAAGFGLGRSDGMVGTPRRRGDGVEAAGVLPSRAACRRSSRGAGSAAGALSAAMLGRRLSSWRLWSISYS